jgi:ankyrin repeat protein
MKGNIEAIKQHLAAGKDVNAPDTYGYTSLHFAAYRGHKEIVELLIAKGADVNALDGLLQQTPLDYAEGETADLLRKHGGKTSLWLRAGESIHIAAAAGHIEAFKQFLAAGEDVNAKDKNGCTGLHHAALAGRIEITQLLIAKGVDVNAKNVNGVTPLHRVTFTGQKEIAELLIAAGADVNAKADNGWTPLHNAAGNNKEVVELLIAKGADLNAKVKGGDHKGATPLDVAIDFFKNTKTADLLRKHGGKTGEELKAEGK